MLTRELSSWIKLEEKFHIYTRSCSILYVINKGDGTGYKYFVFVWRSWTTQQSWDQSSIMYARDPKGKTNKRDVTQYSTASLAPSI